MSLQPIASTLPKIRQSPARPAPAEPVEFSYNPQDQLVMSPGTLKLSGLNADLTSQKVALSEPLEPVNGKYVYEPGDARFHGANAFAAGNRTLDLFTEAYGQPVQWATGREKLSITPNAGNDFNAYYSRDDGGLLFFEGVDPKSKRWSDTKPGTRSWMRFAQAILAPGRWTRELFTSRLATCWPC